MRRILSVVLIVALAGLLHIVATPAASAATAIVGQVVDSGTDLPVAGTTLRLRVDDAGVPGAVVATATTEVDGEFSITPPAAGSYWVEVLRDANIQGGYVSDFTTGPSAVQAAPSDPAAPIPNGTHLGRVLALPSYIQGFVVNPATGARVRGIRV